MCSVYEVQSGDSPRSFAKKRLGNGATNQEIANEVKKLPSIYGCKSMEEFQKKYFSKVGTKIQIDFKGNNTDNRSNRSRSTTPNGHSNHTRPNFTLTDRSDTSRIAAADATRVDSNYRAIEPIFENKTSNRTDSTSRIKKTPAEQKGLMDTIVARRRARSWTDIQARQNAINNLSSESDKIIAYNRDFAHIKDNYVIVDKKNYTATVYAPDGSIVKRYEIGVSNNVTDQLIEGNGHGGWKVRATSAGIYTANYRGTGRDAYRSTYNNRILTLSNDGLREKGIGNGETGVALHQVPNGAGGQRRAEKLRKPGSCAENNRFSAGCVNFLPEDFDDCMKQINGVGTKVYILPEDDNNYFTVKNGRLHFAQKNYTGNVATTTTKNDPIAEIRITNTNSDLREEASSMASTLSVNKRNLAKDLGIDNDTYNTLALTTLGIAGAETEYGSPTANIGKGRPYWVKENMQGLVNKAKSNEGNTSYNSRGITQLKIGSYTDPEVKNLMEKYGITPDNLCQPEKAAIGTMIVLSCIYKNELPALKKHMQNLSLTNEQALLYCFNGRKSQITEEKATPDKNLYIQSVNNYKKNFNLMQNG